MDKVTYPLLYFELQPDTILGLLVGTEYEVMDKDLRSVKMTLKNHLQKQYKKYNSYAPTYLLEPQLKTVQLTVKPAYVDNAGSYPLAHNLSVPVVAIYGANSLSDFECILPMLNRRFHYYEAAQLDTLIQHFATSILNQMQPEEIYQLLQYPTPKLDEVTLKVNTDRYLEWKGFFTQRTYKTLNELTEPFPYPKNIRKKISILPDVAWELEEKGAN